MRTKYFNNGVVGNQNIKASFTNTGELIRLLYGAADYKQFVDTFQTGVKVNDSEIIYLHQDCNNEYVQNYIENTNILETQIYNKYFKLRIKQTDFIPVDEKVLIKKYTFRNDNCYDLKVDFIAYSKILTDINNDTSGFIKENSLIQYNHDFSICTFSNTNLSSSQVNGVTNNLHTGVISGKDYIGMSPDSAISYDLEVIKPGEEKEITLFMFITKNKVINVLNDLDSEIDRIKRFNVDKMLSDTIEYWKKYLKDHDEMKVNEKNINESIKRIYNRTILLMPLLYNAKTGGVSAGIEIDEFKTLCGRYSYCWPRDGVFITEALDLIGMEDISEKFYSTFCQMTQSRNGMWEQRFYTDGRLAPCWGYQIDETASVIFGTYAHYKVCKSITFLKENVRMLEDAVGFLIEYIDDVINEKNKLKKSYDLWEEFEGTTLYSMSAVYAALSAMVKIYHILEEEIQDNESKLEYYENNIAELKKLAIDVKAYCLNNFYDEERKSFVRNAQDKKVDISMLGVAYPFKMLPYEDERVVNTVERINETIKTYTGGYLRYENDGYKGGKNPWPIATLWMALYYIKVENYDEALRCFEYVVKSATNLGFLGEQVDDATMEPCWVIGLTWSHAMFVGVLYKLLQKGII